MAGEKSEGPQRSKGERVAIVGGKKGVGVRGDIFWTGENKYGPGFRYGVKGDDGDTYWVDETQVADEKDGPPAPERTGPPPEEFDKGDRVQIVRGRDKGVHGNVFWTGENKYGPGKRYGVKGDDDETYWVDQPQVERSDTPSPEKTVSTASGRPAPGGAASEFSDEDFPPLDPDDRPAAAGPPPAFDDAPPPADDDFYDGGGAEEGDASDIPF